MGGRSATQGPGRGVQRAQVHLVYRRNEAESSDVNSLHMLKLKFSVGVVAQW